MRVNDWLAGSQTRLRAAGIPSARLDCVVLLEDALGQDRAYILAHPETEISKLTEVGMNKKIAQRVTHVPLAYIRGKAEFYGREFRVNRHVLVPRPETEALIDLLKSIALPPQPLLADIGTGSGCIGVTAALEIPGSTVHFYDVDEDALATANHNARKYNVRGQYYTGDLLEHYAGPYDIILANLPYVPNDYPVNEAARHEPKLALYAGSDGLELYRRLWTQITEFNPKPKQVLTESLPFQHQPLQALARDAGYHITRTQGLIQQFELIQ